MRALFGVILVGFTALIAGAIGYQAGISSNVATAAATSGTVVYHAGWGFGFPWFGFLLFPFFLFLFFGLFAFAFGGRRRGPWGPGSGPGRWGPWDADRQRRPAPPVGRRRPSPAPRGGGAERRRDARFGRRHPAPDPFDPPRPTAG